MNIGPASGYSSFINDTLSHLRDRIIGTVAGRSLVGLRPGQAASLGAAFASGLLVACAASSGTASDGVPGRIRVATTIYPIEYFAERIGGESVEIVSLIPPGVEAHDFEPRVSDLIDIARADLFIYNGAEFEPWVGRALKALGGDAPPSFESVELLRTSLFAASGDENPNENGDEGFDPHVWLSPLNAVLQVEAIVSALSTFKPGLAGEYESAGNVLIGQLESLDRAFRSGLSECGLDTFVTSHAAYGYLADEYGLEQIAVAGLSPDAEPKPRTLAKIARRMTDLGVSYVLVEPIANARVGDTLARETGAGTLPLHPLESLTKEEQAGGADYFSIMNQNLETLVVALECN